MYKCSECGEIFEEPATVRETHGFTDGFAETFFVCPYCNGAYEEAKMCQECENWHTENELYERWCEKCLRETINYDTFFEYCEANKDEQYLDMFVLSEFCGGMDVPKDITDKFHQIMIAEYKVEVAMYDFRDKCIHFIMDDDGSIGRENYANWLNKREVK